MKRVTLITAATALAIACTSVVATAKGGPDGARGGVEKLFEQFDADGDGSITKAEVEAARAARFAAADTDGDGQLSLEEMTAAADQRRAERMAKRFERLDANSDGFVSAEELRAQAGKRRGPSIERMFEHLDADGDGVITKAEAEEAKPMRRKGKRGDKSE